MLKNVFERAERTLSTEEKRQLEIMLNLYMDLISCRLDILAFRKEAKSNEQSH